MNMIVVLIVGGNVWGEILGSSSSEVLIISYAVYVSWVKSVDVIIIRVSEAAIV